MKSGQHENVMTIDGENKIALNDQNVENEITNGSLPTKHNITKEITNLNENNEMERNFQTLHTQRKNNGKNII